MSSSESLSERDHSPDSKKRKRSANEEELEIDLDAPEPPSKKALRKAKKLKGSHIAQREKDDRNPASKEPDSKDEGLNHGKRSQYGIWIGNLSFSTTEDDLLKFMTSDTEYPISRENITRVKLPAGPIKFGKFQNKGFAYVDFSELKALQSALELSEKLFNGRRVLIKNATDFAGRPEGTAKEASDKPASKRIFIGNLGFDTTVEDLEKHFGVCGPIQHTQVATFEDSGKCKGYAWVEFEQLSSGQAAMRGWVERGSSDGPTDAPKSKQRVWLNKLNGRKLRMEFAEDKTTRYNKRFGKASLQKEERPSITEEPLHHLHQANPDEDLNVASDNGRLEAIAYSSRRQNGKGRAPRYSAPTVKRLVGAIVEGQGQKVVYD